MTGGQRSLITVRLDEFRKLVKSEFGDRLTHATPANVREFVDDLGSRDLVEQVPHRIVLDEPCRSYEEVIKDFFAQVLELPPEEAVVALWTLALDLSFATIESQYSDRLAPMFKDTE
jgi:hypothetical protein